MAGRPSKYSKAIAEKICIGLSEGLSLRSICLSEKFPDKSTVLRWLFDDRYTEFRDQYTKARQVQAELFAEEMVDIADDGTNDWMERNGDDNEGWQQNGEAIARSRLRVDTRKWVASRLLPKVYGANVEEATADTSDLAEALLILAKQLPD